LWSPFECMHKRNAQHRLANTSFFFQGELQSVDGYMNIALEGTREFVDGKMRRSYGDAFVRGNNGMLCLSPNALCISRTILLPRGFSSLKYSPLLALVWQGSHTSCGNGWLMISPTNSDVHFRRLIEWLWHGKCTQVMSNA
jgi:hypothetical protein